MRLNGKIVYESSWVALWDKLTKNETCCLEWWPTICALILSRAIFLRKWCGQFASFQLTNLRKKITWLLGLATAQSGQNLLHSGIYWGSKVHYSKTTCTRILQAWAVMSCTEWAWVEWTWCTEIDEEYDQLLNIFTK